MNFAENKPRSPNSTKYYNLIVRQYWLKSGAILIAYHRHDQKQHSKMPPVSRRFSAKIRQLKLGLKEASRDSGVSLLFADEFVFSTSENYRNNIFRKKI